NAEAVARAWKVDRIPSARGMTTAEMIDAAREARLDVFYIIGGNFLETMPQPAAMDAALQRVPFRIHQDLILNSSMFAEPQETVLLLPGQTRYEQKGGGTITNT